MPAAWLKMICAIFAGLFTFVVKAFPSPGGGVDGEILAGFLPLGVLEHISAAGVDSYSECFPSGSEFGIGADGDGGVDGEFVEVLESNVGVVLVADGDKERAVLVVVRPIEQKLDGAIDEEIDDFTFLSRKGTISFTFHNS